LCPNFESTINRLDGNVVRMLARLRVCGSLARTEARGCARGVLGGGLSSLGIGGNEIRGWGERGVLVRRCCEGSASVGLPSLHYKFHLADFPIPATAPRTRDTFILHEWDKERGCRESVGGIEHEIQWMSDAELCAGLEFK
jgi:hypothetical protein